MKDGNCKYKIDNGYPLNPYGRTGIKGRGVLTLWGPTQAGKLKFKNKIINFFIKIFFKAI